MLDCDPITLIVTKHLKRFYCDFRIITFMLKNVINMILLHTECFSFYICTIPLYA